MRNFNLPDVGEGLHEAELVEWMVQVGDHVAEGTVVAVVNTEKITVELPSPVTGVVEQLHWQPGDTLHVGDPLISFDDAGDDVAAPEQPVAAEPFVHEAKVSPPKVMTMLGRPIASPSTRKLAVESGVDLSTIRGSGPAGRILRNDVEDALSQTQAPRSERSPSAEGTSSEDVIREKLTGLRAKMWQHMSDSTSSRATTTTTFTVRMESVEAMVADMRAADEPKMGVLGVTAACVADALRRHPRFNAVVDPDTGELLVHSDVHLGIAVASPSGLVVPVIPRADRHRLRILNNAIRDVAHRARTGDLKASEMKGGTFTMSSTGGL